MLVFVGNFFSWGIQIWSYIDIISSVWVRIYVHGLGLFSREWWGILYLVLLWVPALSLSGEAPRPQKLTLWYIFVKFEQYIFAYFLLHYVDDNYYYTVQDLIISYVTCLVLFILIWFVLTRVSRALYLYVSFPRYRGFNKILLILYTNISNYVVWP